MINNYITNRKKELKAYLFILAVCILVNIIAYYPALFSGRYLSGDLRQHMYFIPKYFDRDLYSNDVITEFISSITPEGYKLVIYVFYLFLPLYVISLIMPFLLSFIPAIFIYKIGVWLKGPLLGLIMSFAFLIFQPVSELGRGGTIRAFSFVIITSFIYYLLKRDYLKIGVILGLTIWFCPYVIEPCLLTFLIFLFINRSHFSSQLKISKAFRIKFFIIAILIFLSPVLYWNKLASLPDKMKLQSFKELISMPEAGENGWENFKQYYMRNGESIFSLRSINNQLIFSDDYNEKKIRNILLPFALVALFYFFTKYIFRKKDVHYQTNILFIWLFFLNMTFAFFIYKQIMSLQGIIIWYLLYSALFLYIFLRNKSTSALPKEIWLLFISAISVFVLLFFLPDNLKLIFHLPNRRLASVLPIFLILFVSINAMRAYRSLKVRKIGVFFIFSGLFLCVSVIVNYKYWVRLYKCENYELFKYLSSIPKSSMIAGHPYALDSIPFFAQRKVLISNELSFIMSKIWKIQLKERTYDTLNAFYAHSREEFVKFCEKYKNEDVYFIVDNYFLSHNYLDIGKLYFEPFDSYIREITENRDFFLLHIDDNLKIYNDGKIQVIKCNKFIQ